MHALRRAHELLVPGGTLVEVHPLVEEQVEAAGVVLGVIEDPEWRETYLPNAEARLEESIRDGLYVLEEEIEFELRSEVDTAEDVIDGRKETLESLPELVHRIREATPPFTLRERAVARRLRAG